MKLPFIFVCISFLSLANLCIARPVEKNIIEIVDPEGNNLLYIEVQSDSSTKRKSRQDDGEVETSAAQLIGNNVIKVVTSALTGNVNGIFGGSLDLFGTGPTRNSVEGFLNNLVGGLVGSIVGPSTTPNPNAAQAAASPVQSGGGGGGGSAAVAEVVAATTAKSASGSGLGSQYIILLNQSGGQIKGAQIVSAPQAIRQQPAATAAPKPTVRATTKKSEEDEDEEENEEDSGRRGNLNS